MRQSNWIPHATDGIALLDPRYSSPTCAVPGALSWGQVPSVLLAAVGAALGLAASAAGIVP